MKTFVTKLVIVTTLSLCLPVVGSASIFATSDLQISNFLITKADGSAITFSVDPMAGADVTLVALNDTYSLRSEVNGLVDFNSSIFPGNDGASGSPIDGLATGTNGVTTNGAGNSFGIENVFALPAILPFAMSDSTGGGNILLAPGAQVRAYAGVQANNVPSVTDNATGSSSLVSFSRGFENGALDLSIKFGFDALLDIVLQNADPAGILTGSASFVVTLSATNSANPNGFGLRVNGVATNTYVFNEIQAPELNTGTLVAGSDVDYDFAGSFMTTDVIEVLANSDFTFQIQQEAQASLSPIPEPATITVWGILGLIVSAGTRRKRTA